MILRNPYNFKLLSAQNHKTVIDAINEYIVVEYGYLKSAQALQIKDFETQQGPLKPVILYGLTGIESSVAAFNHPLINQANHWIALDLRAFVRIEAGKAEPKNASDYALALTKFVLTGMWVADKQASIYALKLPHVTFAEWLSTSLTRKFGLNVTDQIRIFALAALYYAHLFVDEFTADDVLKLKLRLKNEIFVEGVIDEVVLAAGKLDTVEDFCGACFNVTKSPRLKGMSLGILINVISNNWYSIQGSELAMLSLEHPPTWVSLVNACLTTKSYRNSYVGKIVDAKDKRGAGEELLKGVNMLTQLYKGD